jgi:hypothetical protein
MQVWLATSPIRQPPTSAAKGKANVGPPTVTGIIAPPVPVANIPDDFTLEDDPDVIELDDEILDRYLAITAARETAQKHRKGTASPAGLGKQVRFTLTPTLQTQTILQTRAVHTGRTGPQ